MRRSALSKRPTLNARAYDLFLTGQFYSSSGGWSGSRKALEFFQQAIALDPNFAWAYTGESIAYFNLATAVSSGLSSSEAVRRSQASAEKAIQLDPGLAGAHGALAVVKMGSWDWASAGREYKRALELNPNASGVHGNYAAYLAGVGRHTEALTENDRARELDPLSLFSLIQTPVGRTNTSL